MQVSQINGEIMVEGFSREIYETGTIKYKMVKAGLKHGYSYTKTAGGDFEYEWYNMGKLINKGA